MTDDAPRPKRRKSSNGAGSYRRRPDGRWECRITLADGKRKSVYGWTQNECKDKVKTLLREQDQGRDVGRKDPLVKDFLSEWLAFVDDGTRAAATIKNYRIHINQHIVPAVGNVRLSKLTTKQVDDMLGAMQKDGKSGGTQRIVRTVLKAALTQALRWDMVVRNVATLSKPPVIDQPERVPLTADQLLALVKQTEKHRFGPLYQLAMATGLRQGELLGLRWIDVDFEERTLEVAQALHLGKHGFEIGRPKTAKSRRRIALPEFAVMALRRQEAMQAEAREWAGPRWKESGLIFTSSIGTAPDPGAVTRELHEALDEAGLPSCTFHDLRHAAATLLAKQRVPSEIRRDILGHTTERMTGHYTHVDLEEFRSAAAALDLAFRGNATSDDDAEVAS